LIDCLPFMSSICPLDFLLYQGGYLWLET
jgi:hypothetical protein